MLKPALLWIALAALYLVFAGTLSATEAGSAIVCASLGLIWGRHASRPGPLRLSLPASALRVFATGVAGVPRQLFEVGVALLRAVLHGGALGAVRHRTIGELTPVPAPPTRAGIAGLQAVGIIGASLAPRTFVLHVDHDHDRVTEHDLLAPAGERA